MSCVKLLLVDVNGNHADWEMTQDEAIVTIKMTIQTLGLPKSVGYIIGKNKYDTFVIMFFSATAFNLSLTQLEVLYSRLETNLDIPVSCYVGEITTLQKVRDVEMCIRDRTITVGFWCFTTNIAFWTGCSPT